MPILPAAAPMHAHDGAASIQLAWNWDPVVLSLLIAAAVLYAAGARRLRAVRGWHVASYAAGLATIFAAQISPLDRASDLLFSAHMGQHELLVLIAAPLLVFGRPLAPILHGLPERVRVGIVTGMRRPGARRVWRLLSHPLFVCVLHAVVILGWHVPVLYQTAIRNETIHFVQHAMFLGTAVLFWWALAHGRYGRLGYGMAVLFVFATAMYSGILGALITFAPRLWYPIYDAPARAAQLDPLADQQVAGLIMWVPAGALLVVLGVGFLAAWLGTLERRAPSWSPPQ